MITLDQPAGDRAGFPATYDAAVDFCDGDELRAGAGEETFVGIEQVGAGEVGFADGDAFGAGHFDDDASSDAVKGAGGQRRGEHLAVSEDEQVVASAFGDVA